MNRPDDLFHRHHLRRSPGFFAVPCLITFYSVETEEEDWSVGPGANLEFMACGLACCSQCDTTGVIFQFLCSIFHSKKLLFTDIFRKKWKIKQIFMGQKWQYFQNMAIFAP